MNIDPLDPTVLSFPLEKIGEALLIAGGIGLAIRFLFAAVIAKLRSRP